MGMETTVGVGDEKRKGWSGEEEEEGQGLGFGFGFGSGSTALSTPPQKLIRTDAFPSRYSNSVHLPHPSSSSGPTLFYDCNGGASDAARALHPFPSPLRSTAAGAMTTDFGGVGGAAALRLCCPFTSAQWQELHRQALIYKHLMSSVPVPPDLLLPPNLLGHGGGGLCNMRFTNSTDPEPGRCRRTDGKKWRCSRDVAPDQKYCERHMHRGRPRSRKPVELTKNKANRISTTTTTKLATKASTTSSAIPPPKGFAAQSSGFPSKADLKLPYQSMELSKEPRYTSWMKEDTGEMGSSHQWEMVNSSLDMMRSNRAPILQHYQNQLNLNYTDLNDQCYTFLNPDLSSMDEESIADQREPPRSFIDAWSTETPTATDTTNSEDKLCSVSHSGKLPLSTLSLSMNSGIEEGTDQIEMGLGLSDSMGRSQPLSWMTTVSPLGGPLAEVLQSTTSPSPYNGHCCGGSGFVNLMSKSLCGSQEVSPQESPTRLASSPSGVLQKALVSLSDSSSSSSPTFASRSEIALQWLNQSK